MLQMLDFRERSRFRRVLYSKPTILVLFVVTILVARGAFGMYQKSEEAIAKRDKAAGELDVLRVREAELRDDIAQLSTERGQEEVIRDRFMVAKEGEKVIIVTDPEAKKVHTVTVTEGESPQTFVEKIKSAVGVSEN